MSWIAQLGRFESPIELPAPWGAVPYLLSNHGDAKFHGVWTTADAFLTLTSGMGRSLGLLGLGDPAGVARVLASEEVAEAIGPLDITWLTVPRDAMARCPEVLVGPLAHLDGRTEWEWMWTGGPLVDASPDGVERLEPSPEVAREVQEFLAVAHPESRTPVTDPRIFAWWALRHEGRMRAVVGAMRFAPGLGSYLVSLGVDPEHRGRGLARTVLAAAVRDGLAEPLRVGGGVSLAVYSANEPAQRLYLKHGFETQHRFESVRAG